MNPTRRQFLQSAACGVAIPLLTSRAFAQATRPAAATSARQKIRSFSYADVKLLSGPLKDQFDRTFDFFMKLDNERMLKVYRQLSGLAAPGEELAGWYKEDGFCPGHTLGQWMSALSRFSAATGGAAAREKVAQLVHGFGEAIAGPKSFYDGHRFKGYCYDKHVIGMVDAFRYAGVVDAKSVFAKATELALKVLPEKALTREEQAQRPHKDVSYTWDEFYTLPENLFIAHETFGDDRYLEMAKRYLHDKPYFEPLANGKNALVGQHAYSHVNALSSAAKAHLVLGDEMHFLAARNGFDFVLAQSYASGGWGPNETFVEPGKGKLFESLGSTHNHFETPCGSYAQFKITRYLMSITGESRYGDALERMLYNGILSAKPIRPDGTSFYYSDYQRDGHKNYYGEKWPCCSGTYPQAIADYLVSAYFHDDDGVYVNLYAPSQVRWGDVTLTQETEYPAAEKVKVRVSTPQPKKFAVRLRIPKWADGAKVEGERTTPQAGTFFTVTRTWRDGDTIELTLPLRPRTEAIDEQHPDVVALMRGPIMMVATQDRLQVPREAIEQVKDVGGNVTASQQLKFVPFYHINEEAYTTYFTQT